MSLIADALKTAQREKQRRESGGRDSVSPVLVPLRGKPSDGFSWGRTATIAVSLFVIAGSLVVMVQRMRKPSGLSPLPSVASPLAGTPLLSDSAKRPVAPPRVVDARRVVTAPAVETNRDATRPSARVARATPNRPDIVQLPAPIPQGQTHSDTVAAARARPAGGLRITVDRPGSSDTANLFAQALRAHRAGDLPLARGLYERLLIGAPDHADALNNLGVLLSTQRDFDRALDYLRRAASVAPNNAGTWNNIGAALREQGRTSDALAAFKHALTIDPAHPGAKVGLAQIYLGMRSPAEARPLLEDVVAANPTLPEARYALGQALEMLGDRAGAVRELTAFIRLAPPRLAEHVERVRRHLETLGAP